MILMIIIDVKHNMPNVYSYIAKYIYVYSEQYKNMHA